MRYLILLLALLAGCENHYVPPAEKEQFVEVANLSVAQFEQLESNVEKSIRGNHANDLYAIKKAVADIKASQAELEARVANLELRCIDGKPEPPKEKAFAPQVPKKKLSIRERVKCYIYSQDSCVPCAELKSAIEKDLCGKLGWTCGESDDCDFIFRDSNAWPSYPVIEFRIDDSPKRRVFGRIPTADLSNELKRLMDNLDREA